ncbi:MAG: hypothetical protein M5U18_19500 [Dehalococcoidia bacterium]|nr:hypothetical protein [Dehalococcoidia bacterium]
MGATTIEPGGEVPVVLSLPMGMHSGMDGPHLFRIVVPLRDAAGETGEAEVYFKALFK